MQSAVLCYLLFVVWRISTSANRRVVAEIMNTLKKYFLSFYGELCYNKVTIKTKMQEAGNYD